MLFDIIFYRLRLCHQANQLKFPIHDMEVAIWVSFLTMLTTRKQYQVLKISCQFRKLRLWKDMMHFCRNTHSQLIMYLAQFPLFFTNLTN